MADTALKQVGVELVAKNEAGFTQALGNANKTVQNFGATASGTGSKSALLMGAAMGVMSGVAMAAIGAVAGLTQKIVASASAAFANATELQNLTISLESLAAREQLGADKAENMNEALSQAGPIAQDLLEKIRKLSVESPFEYKDIVGVFRLNMAFGQTADMSLKLTKAITDVTAASGQGSYIMQRLAYNFSQMSMTGQVTMRDVRDLAMAGFDLARVFEDELGMSVQEVNAQLKAGKLTMEDVSTAFVEYADKNFGGAAQRMSRTITGVMSSMRDLAFFASTDVLGGALNNIGTALANVFDRARAITDSGVLQVVGVVFEVLTSRAVEASNKLPVITESTLTSMGDKFMAFTEQAFDYGLNIMVSFADGIVDGASYVVDAVLWITSAIAGLLMPGSPPKALPDLPKWGASAMMEYLKGFTKTDFDVLKAIQRPIEQALSVMQIGGGIDPMQSAKLYAGFSKSLAEMISSGSLNEKVFQQIANATGPYGDEIARLARLQTELAIATKAVTQAQQTEQKAYSTLAKKVFEYNRMVKEGASAAELAAKRMEVDQASATAEVATAEREATEEKYSNIDALKEQVDLQNELVSQMLDIARMQAQAARQAKMAGGGGGGGFTVPDTSGGMDAVMSAWEQKIAEFRKRLKEKFDLAMIDVGKHFQESSVGKLLDAIKQALFGDTFTQDISNQPWLMLPGMENVLNIPESKVAGLEKLLELITGKDIDFSAVQAVADAIQGFTDKVKEIWTYVAPAAGVVGKFLGVVLAVALAIEAFQLALAGLILYLAGSALVGIITFISENFGKVRESAEGVAGIVSGYLTQAWSSFVTFIQETVLPAFTSLWQYLNDHVFPIFQTIADIVSIALNLAFDALKGILVNYVIPALTTLWDWLDAKIFPALEKTWDIIANSLEPAWTSLKDNAIAPFLQLVKDLTKAIGEGLTKALDAINEKLETFRDWLAKVKLPDWLNPGSPTPFEIGLDGINNSLQSTNEKVYDLKKSLKSLDGQNAVVSMLAGNVSPSYAMAGGGTTYNVSIPVTASISNDQDVHKLAYVIAREFNQRMNR